MYIRQSCESNIRQDGRSTLGHRPYSLISPNYSPILSNASARLLLPGSSTDITCSIKAELVHPPFYASKGIIDLKIDILPYATDSVERRNIRKEELELTSTLSHLILPHVMDRNNLVIVTGRYVWRLNIDLVVMHNDGNLIDACSMAIFGAMQKFRLPKVNAVEVEKSDELNSSEKIKITDELLIDSDVRNSVNVNGADCPVVITVAIVPSSDVAPLDMEGRYVQKRRKNSLIIDTTKLEEACASSIISLSIDRCGHICGVYKKTPSSASDISGNIPYSMLSDIQRIAVDSSKVIFDLLLTCIETNAQHDSMNCFFRPCIELR